jgi:hypothetical protein
VGNFLFHGVILVYALLLIVAGPRFIGQLAWSKRIKRFLVVCHYRALGWRGEIPQDSRD